MAIKIDAARIESPYRFSEFTGHYGCNVCDADMGHKNAIGKRFKDAHHASWCPMPQVEKEKEKAA